MLTRDAVKDETSALAVLVSLRDYFARTYRVEYPGLFYVERDSILGMESHHFDMILEDGRVYRVRVSDITPEPAGVEGE